MGIFEKTSNSEYISLLHKKSILIYSFSSSCFMIAA